jgi:phosphoribosylglycinamide formyltransferase/phosphoribosylglycinamide formyltransferase-1
VLRAEHRLFPLCVEAVASGAVVLGDDGRARGHVDVPGDHLDPQWRFGLVPDTTTDAAAFASEWARLLPR